MQCMPPSPSPSCRGAGPAQLITLGSARHPGGAVGGVPTATGSASGPQRRGHPSKGCWRRVHGAPHGGDRGRAPGARRQRQSARRWRSCPNTSRSEVRPRARSPRSCALTAKLRPPACGHVEPQSAPGSAHAGAACVAPRAMAGTCDLARQRSSWLVQTCRCCQ